MHPGAQGAPGRAQWRATCRRCSARSTAVVTMQNGIPWWYFQKHGGEFEGRRGEDASTRRHRSPQRSRPSASSAAWSIRPPSCIAPGVVKRHRGQSLPAGRARRQQASARQRLSDAFTRAGFKSPVLDDIRAEIWLKLWGNLTFNPISALTHSTLVDICQFPLTRELAADDDDRGADGRATSSASRFASRSTSASPAPRRSASTRPRCCRTSRPAARSRSTRWSAR